VWFEKKFHLRRLRENLLQKVFPECSFPENVWGRIFPPVSGGKIRRRKIFEKILKKNFL